MCACRGFPPWCRILSLFPTALALPPLPPAPPCRFLTRHAWNPLPPLPIPSSLQLSVSGLLGGHSGLNIAEGRGNAVQLLARALAAVDQAAAAAAGGEAAGSSSSSGSSSNGNGSGGNGSGDPGWRLVSAGGGDKRNAIARDASAVILVRARGAWEARVCVLNKEKTEQIRHTRARNYQPLPTPRLSMLPQLSP